MIIDSDFIDHKLPRKILGKRSSEHLSLCKLSIPINWIPKKHSRPSHNICEYFKKKTLALTSSHDSKNNFFISGCLKNVLK